MQLIARLVVAYLTMSVLTGFLNGVISSTHPLYTAGYVSDAPVLLAVVLLITSVLAIPLAMLYGLLFLVGPRVDALCGLNGQGDKIDDRWITGGYRLLAAYFGLGFIGGSVDFVLTSLKFFVTAPRVIIDMVFHRYVDDMFRLDVQTGVLLLIDAARFAAGLYLLYGAPGLVACLCRWWSPDKPRQT